MLRSEAKEEIVKHPGRYLRLDRQSEYKRSGKVGYICPICKSGSGAKGTGIVSKDNVHFTCFAGGCFTNADIIDIIGLEYGLSNYNDKLEKACELYGINYKELESDLSMEAPRKQQEKSQKAQEETLNDYTGFFKECAEHRDESDYLEKRGISKKVQISFSTGFCRDWRSPTACKNKNGFIPPPTPRIIIPTSRHSYIARDTRTNLTEQEKKFAKMKEGKVSIFNLKALEQTNESIFVVEGEIDALSIEELGHHAIGLGSVSNVNTFIEYLKTHKEPTQGILIALDNDKAGKDGSKKLLESLKTIGVKCCNVQLCGTHKDVNDRLIADRDGLKSDLESALKMAKDCCKMSLNDVSLDYFHKYNKNGVAYDIIDNRIAEHIIKTQKIIVIAGKPYLYNNGVYVKDEYGNILKHHIKSLVLDELITSRRINRVYELILMNYELEVKIENVNKHPKEWINFKNGFLDVRNMRMIKHSPEYLSINQIPYDFDIHKQVLDNSVVLEFLKSTIPNKDDLEMLLQYAGYAMTTDTHLQKFLIISGVGGTGKSTIIRLINQAIGNENISNLSLQDLNERFTATNLFGKLFNSCADISNKAMEQVDIIKKLTGEDMVKGEYKGGAVFYFKSYAKLLFSANEIPVSLDDKTNAYYRRFLILRIDKKGHIIENLEERLASSVDDFIILAVQALHRMYQTGLVESESSKENVLELHKASDTVTAFLDDEMWVENFSQGGNFDSQGGNFRVERTKLYKAYENYCKENERQPFTKNGFYKNLRNKGFSEPTIHGCVYFSGLKFKENDFVSYKEKSPFN